MLIDGLARTPGTLLRAELLGDDWTIDQHLLAVVADRVAVGNWQRQGRRGAKRPPPISPLARHRTVEQVGDVSGRSRDEVVVLLDNYRRGVFDRG